MTKLTVIRGDRDNQSAEPLDQGTGPLTEKEAPSASETSTAATPEELRQELNRIIKTVYEEIAAVRPEAVKNIDPKRKMTARMAGLEAQKKESVVFINDVPCESKRFKEEIINLLQEGLPYIEMKMPGAVALKLGNQHMEGNYNLDIFVEAVYTRILEVFLKISHFETSISLTIGTPVYNEHGEAMFPDFYIVKIVNKHPKIELVPEEEVG